MKQARMYKPILLQLGKQKVRVNQFGGGLISYEIQEDTSVRQILYSYNEPDHAGAMGDVLFPFPGRIKNGSFTFEGEKYQLQNVTMNGSNAIHGFVAQELWEIEDVTDNSVVLSFAITKEQFQLRGYPFSLTIRLKYILNESGLTIESTIINKGENNAPFGLGFHPYFRVGTEMVDEITLALPANKLVEFNDALEPTGALLSPTSASVDFQQPASIGEKVMDSCFTDLQYEQGLAHTTISNGDESITVWQDEHFPYLQVYTSDTLPDENYRKGLAIEAQTCTGFAFNYPAMGLRVLKPSEVFVAKWGIAI